VNWYENCIAREGFGGQGIPNPAADGEVAEYMLSKNSNASLKGRWWIIMEMQLERKETARGSKQPLDCGVSIVQTASAESEAHRSGRMKQLRQLRASCSPL
jgi:hypothetical protein